MKLIKELENIKKQAIDVEAMNAANRKAKACWTLKGHVMTIIEFFDTRVKIAEAALKRIKEGMI